MKRLLCLLAIAAVSALYTQAVAPSKPDDEEDPYFLLCGQADKAISEGEYGEAAARLIDAISLRPDSPESILLMSNLGMVYCYMDRDSLAIATLDEAHRRAPAMRTVIANRAKVLLKTGRDKEAFRDFGSVIAADSLNIESRFYHGTIALYNGDLTTAEADFNILKEIDPESSATAQALSALYSLTERNSEAMPYFKRLIDTEPAAEYYAGLAGCQLALGRLGEAGTTIAEGLAKYPDDAELYYYRARLNRDRYRLDEAHADASKAIKLGLNPTKAKELFR
ncbi:MAG: hypothetical protein K2K22_02755 [Muribaculaceae bacterium]|nr:hypothetical protein [Muribaculaceae bacterium]MDE6611460.1 hypothetical protein [Muribaculaceae bacterium]